MTNFNFVWKTVLVLGGVTPGIILALKMKPEDAKEAFNRLADASKEWAIAIKALVCSNHSGT